MNYADQIEGNPQKLVLQDVAAFYRQYHRDILAFTNSLVHDLDLAEEFAHDVFYKLCLDIQKGGVANINIRAYLFRVARNHCIDHFRKKKINTSDIDAVAYSLGKNGEQKRIENGMLIETIYAFVEMNFPEEEKSVFKLKFYHECSQEEIAGIMEISPATVSRIVKRIAEKLNNEFPEIL